LVEHQRETFDSSVFSDTRDEEIPIPVGGSDATFPLSLASGLILRASAALGLVEAAHDGQGDWQAWCERLLHATQRFLSCSLVNLGVLQRHEQRYECVANVSTVPGMREMLRGQVARMSPTEMDPFARYPAYLGTLQGMLGPEPPASEVAEFITTVGNVDVLGLVGIVDEYTISVGGPYAVQRLKISAADQRLLKQVALHLEAGLRLRLRKSAEVGVLSPDGRVLHAESGLNEAAGARGELSRHVARVERIRTRRQRTSSTAADAWSALVSGEWGIVERTDADGKRYYGVIETHCSPRLKALTPLETQVTELSARGLTGKAVAYALGLTAPAVSRTLFSATLKLGLGSRTELVGLAARLLGTPRAAAQESSLSPAERDVLAFVRMGYTNAVIANARQRSERTVANQVASLLKKLDAPSRRALASAG
jgi:DNA-binding NarL/FixJ family response regulator